MNLSRFIRAVAVLAVFCWVSPAQVSSFDVFCTDNSDGTRTCTGWEGGETLTCVSSRGSITSCSTPSGRSFTCVQGLGGVISCSPPSNQSGRRTPGPRCVPAGDGSLVCDEEDPPSEPMLEAPGLPRATEPVIRPALEPLRQGGLTIPSLFD